MDTDFETPPMGGENIPFNELKTEVPSVNEIDVKAPKKNNKMLVGLIILLTILLLTFILLFFVPKKQIILLIPSPFVSPSSLPEASNINGLNLKERINTLENSLKNLDLEESKLQPPVLDYQLRFQLKEEE